MKLQGLCFLILFLTRPAFAMVLTEFGLVNFSGPLVQSQVNPILSTTPGLSLGIGVSFEFKVSKDYEFETAILYVGRKFSTTSTASNFNSYSLTVTQVPLVIRYRLNSNFSFGGGIYVAHGVGNVTLNSNGTLSQVGLQDIPWAYDDYGFVASLRYWKPMTEVLHLVLDGRTNLGLTNTDTSGSGAIHFFEVQTWAGLGMIL